MLNLLCAIEHREEWEFCIVFSPLNFSSLYIMQITVRLHSSGQIFHNLDTFLQTGLLRVHSVDKAKQEVSEQLTEHDLKCTEDLVS